MIESKLFKIDRIGITKHMNNIYKDEELKEYSTCAKIAHMEYQVYIDQEQELNEIYC